MLNVKRRYHVEEVPDPGSSAQVPDVDVPVVSGGQHDTGVKGVGLQHKHLVIVTLREEGVPGHIEDNVHSGHMEPHLQVCLFRY